MADACVHNALDGIVREENAVEGDKRSTALRDSNISVALVEKAKEFAEVAVHNILDAEHATECAVSKTGDTCAAELAHKTKAVADAAVRSVMEEGTHAEPVTKWIANTFFNGLLSAEQAAQDALY